MSNFKEVLAKTISSLPSHPTPEIRERVYTKARETVRAKLDLISPPPPKAVAQRQIDALEAAIVEIETNFLSSNSELNLSSSSHSPVIIRRSIIRQKVAEDAKSLSILSGTLLFLIEEERDRLSEYRPNSAAEKARKMAQVDLLDRLECGLNSILSGLISIQSSVDQPPEQMVEETVDKVETLATSYSEWFDRHREDAVDLSVRLPVAITAIALLNQLGAEMTVATTAIFAMVGGEKLKQIFRKEGKDD